MLLAFPPDDSVFERVASAEVRAIRAGRVTIRGARRQLRHSYPEADLYRQRAVMVRGRRAEIWFAYREGHGEVSVPGGVWWRQRGTARAVIHSSRRLSSLNRACRELLGMAEASGRPTLARDILPAELCDALTDGADAPTSDGECTSTTILRREGEEDLPVEFHVVRHGDGRGRHVLALRSRAQRDADQARHAVQISSLGLLSPRQQRDLLRLLPTHKLAPGERLPESVGGESWVALVLSGVVRVYVATESIDATVQYGRHGSLLGTPWLGGREAAMGLQAVTPARLLLISPRGVARRARTDVAFTRALSTETRLQLRDLVVAYAVRSVGTLRQRLAREILLLSEMQHSHRLVSVTEQQLAEGVGSIRESVARAIASLRRRGWLATTRYGIIVLDAAALRATADVGIG